VPLAGLVHLLAGYTELVQQNFKDLVFGVHGGGTNGPLCLRPGVAGVKKPGGEPRVVIFPGRRKMARSIPYLA
jgi:hypothetical protein